MEVVSSSGRAGAVWNAHLPSRAAIGGVPSLRVSVCAWVRAVVVVGARDDVSRGLRVVEKVSRARRSMSTGVQSSRRVSPFKNNVTAHVTSRSRPERTRQPTNHKLCMRYRLWNLLKTDFHHYQ